MKRLVPLCLLLVLVVASTPAPAKAMDLFCITSCYVNGMNLCGARYPHCTSDEAGCAGRAMCEVLVETRCCVPLVY